MQLSYNNQSFLATGCYEAEDPGITRFGKQAIAEMNRVGLVIDMSHSAERSTLEAIEISERPIAITHANPHWWHPALRNKSDQVIKALTDKGGMLGFSLYPHHLAGGTDCTLESFCGMISEAADRYMVRARLQPLAFRTCRIGFKTIDILTTSKTGSRKLAYRMKMWAASWVAIGFAFMTIILDQ